MHWSRTNLWLAAVVGAAALAEAAAGEEAAVVSVAVAGDGWAVEVAGADIVVVAAVVFRATRPACRGQHRDLPRQVDPR